MAKRKPDVKFEDHMHWLALPLAAKRIGVTKRQLQAMAGEGKAKFQPDGLGQPWWFAESDIAALRKDFLTAEREREAKRKPRSKTAKQLEAEWARQAKANQKELRDGPFLDVHLKLTLPQDDPDDKK